MTGTGRATGPVLVGTRLPRLVAATTRPTAGRGTARGLVHGHLPLRRPHRLARAMAVVLARGPTRRLAAVARTTTGDETTRVIGTTSGSGIGGGGRCLGIGMGDGDRFCCLSSCERPNGRPLDACTGQHVYCMLPCCARSLALRPIYMSLEPFLSSSNERMCALLNT